MTAPVTAPELGVAEVLDRAAFPASALTGVEAALEPHVRQASEAIYEQIMETVQDYLRDNAGYNIGQQIAVADREAAYARGRLVEMTKHRDVLWSALSNLKLILDRAESNASGTMEWEAVSRPVAAARAALRSAAEAARSGGVA